MTKVTVVGDAPRPALTATTVITSKITVVGDAPRPAPTATTVILMGREAKVFSPSPRWDLPAPGAAAVGYRRKA